jgi:hypothetical protein
MGHWVVYKRYSRRGPRERGRRTTRSFFSLLPISASSFHSSAHCIVHDPYFGPARQATTLFPLLPSRLVVFSPSLLSPTVETPHTTRTQEVSDARAPRHCFLNTRTLHSQRGTTACLHVAAIAQFSFFSKPVLLKAANSVWRPRC